MLQSPTIQWVLQNLRNEHKSEETENNYALEEVSALTQKAGSFYEKIRYAVDYKEEHSIRRSAIERILKRKIILEGKRDFELSLLQELVSVGYVSNNFVPKDLEANIKNIIEKYLALESSTVKLSKRVSLMATEIERLLYPQIEEELIVDAFYSNIVQQIEYTGSISESQLQLQIYIACRRSLLEEDNDTLLFSVLAKYIPALSTLTRDSAGEYKEKFAEVMPFAEADIEEDLNWKIYTKIKNQTVFFLVIKELIKKFGSYSEVILNDPDRLEIEVKTFLQDTFKEQKDALKRSGNRAVVYVLVTKVTLALALEVPFEKLIYGYIDYVAIGTNIIFHPLLLLAIIKGANLPGEKDEAIIIDGVRDVLADKLDTLVVKAPKETSAWTVIFYVLYALLFAISFGGIVWVLDFANFSAISIMLFIFFLAIVSYFGFRLRYNTRKWKVHKKDDGILSLLWYFLTLPIVRAGRWLSNKFSSVNVFVFVLDFILETPFKFILGTFDGFMSFLKDKRDDPH